MSDNVETEVGSIGNYYGGLTIRKNYGKYEWSIENWNGHSWEEIPKALYDEILKHAESGK